MGNQAIDSIEIEDEQIEQPTTKIKNKYNGK